jgi:hypothetical protein
MWQEELTGAERAELRRFGAWLLRPDGWGLESADAADDYRTYAAETIVRLRRGERWEDLSSNVRSGARAFRRWLDAGKP